MNPLDLRDALTQYWLLNDWFHLTEPVFHHYRLKSEIFSAIRPKKVIEIGSRAGYSLVAFDVAHPFTRYLLIDGGLDADSEPCLAHLRRTIADRRIDAELLVTDSHALKSLPAADFAHVDGDHSTEGALADLRLVAHVPCILADDCDNPHVLEAVRRFRDETDRAVQYLDDGFRRLALIT